jgi:site-specific DNA recombinase
VTVRLSPITKRLSALRAARRFLLRANEAEAILVVKLDRLTRSVHDLGVLLDEYFTHPRFALLSVSENIDTRSAGGRLVLNVLASVAQWEREAIGERTKAALGVKRHRGQYTGGRPPYGWRLGTDGTTLDPDPAEQAVIAEAGSLRERGWSHRGRARPPWHAEPERNAPVAICGPADGRHGVVTSG